MKSISQSLDLSRKVKLVSTVSVLGLALSACSTSVVQIPSTDADPYPGLACGDVSSVDEVFMSSVKKIEEQYEDVFEKPLDKDFFYKSRAVSLSDESYEKDDEINEELVKIAKLSCSFKIKTAKMADYSDSWFNGSSIYDVPLLGLALTTAGLVILNDGGGEGNSGPIDGAAELAFSAAAIAELKNFTNPSGLQKAFIASIEGHQCLSSVGDNLIKDGEKLGRNLEYLQVSQSAKNLDILASQIERAAGSNETIKALVAEAREAEKEAAEAIAYYNTQRLAYIGGSGVQSASQGLLQGAVGLAKSSRILAKRGEIDFNAIANAIKATTDESRKFYDLTEGSDVESPSFTGTNPSPVSALPAMLPDDADDGDSDLDGLIGTIQAPVPKDANAAKPLKPLFGIEPERYLNLSDTDLYYELLDNGEKLNLSGDDAPGNGNLVAYSEKQVQTTFRDYSVLLKRIEQEKARKAKEDEPEKAKRITQLIDSFEIQISNMKGLTAYFLKDMPNVTTQLAALKQCQYSVTAPVGTEAGKDG